jgi:hypothetical protein
MNTFSSILCVIVSACGRTSICTTFSHTNVHIALLHFIVTTTSSHNRQARIRKLTKNAEDALERGTDVNAAILVGILPIEEQRTPSVDINGSCDTADFDLDAGPDRCCPPITFDTPLHLCFANYKVTKTGDALVESSPLTTARLLLNYGAAWDSLDEEGYSPLHHALLNGMVGSVPFLLAFTTAKFN